MKCRHSILPAVIGCLKAGAMWLGAALSSTVAMGEDAREFVFQHENVLGTSLELRVRAPSEAEARRLESAALAEFDRLNALFSTYAPESELSRWQRTRGEAVQVSPELMDLMQASDQWRARTGGAFNPGVEVLTRLWTAAAVEGKEPAAADLSAMVTLIAAPAWRLEVAAGTATRLVGFPVSFDAIAKGAIIDRAGAAALAAVPSVSALVVNSGGDLRTWGDMSHLVAITNPHASADNGPAIATVNLENAAIATSGGYRRGFVVNGVERSHLIDARTGRPAGSVASASVIAPDAATADVLATAFSILDPKASAQIAEEIPGVAFLLITSDGGIIRSNRWPSEQAPMAGGAPLTDESMATHWGQESELLVKFELRQPGPRQRFNRPYVAIWIEDGSDQMIRNLLVWYAGERWLADLRRWGRMDEKRTRSGAVDVFPLISSATRRPGRYLVTWDGLDDEKRPVPPGEYTVFIEAVREHGTYQLMRGTVTVGGEPFQMELPGNEEISSGSLEYQRRKATGN